MSGVDFSYSTAAAGHRPVIVESLGGGCGIFDADRDGDLDLVFPGGGGFGPDGQPLARGCGLFLQVGPWNYVPATRESGLTNPRHYTHGVAIGDYDADGFAEVLFTGYGGLQLYRNQGDGTFADQTDEAGLTDRLWSTSAAWGDMNGDGFLDLFVCHYVDWSVENDPECAGDKPGVPEVCQPRQFQGLPDTLYLSNGDGSLRDASTECGLQGRGKGLGVVLIDLDGDGDLDVFVANDTAANFLYRNLGSTSDGVVHFEEIGVESGTAFNEMGTPNSGMGVAILDYNLDGRPDVWVSTYEFESPALYRNDGDLFFLHVSQTARIAVGTSSYVGFGTVAGDFDGDGDDDVLIANGHVLRYPIHNPVRQPCLLHENLGDGTFRNVTSEAGDCLNVPHTGRGLAKADLDGDGDLDVVLSSSDEPVRLFENTAADARGVRLRLAGRHSPRDGEGAKVVVRFSGGERLYQVYSGESYLSSVVSSVFCGVPAHARPCAVEIRWPSGATQFLPDVGLGTELYVVEPE